ncbi:hypothetical protein F5Y11DRAFT_320663 [Daldinia sp. FL1419]|nr:hypothetical protein F5Y11DRAFT_320663 [Daldinia sp. FL1419]
MGFVAWLTFNLPVLLLYLLLWVAWDNRAEKAVELSLLFFSCFSIHRVFLVLCNSAVCTTAAVYFVYRNPKTGIASHDKKEHRGQLLVRALFKARAGDCGTPCRPA